MFKGYIENPELSRYHPELEGKPFAYFQPILSIEDKEIVGYEALARGRNKEGKVVSLGSIFLRHDIPREDLYSLDLAVREDAIRRFAESGLYYKRKLFLNIMPRWLEVINPEQSLEEALPIIKLTQKYCVPPSSIVLEITEGEFGLGPERFDAVISFLKSKGFLIAIDDFGAGFSNVGRIGILKPNFIKLDLHLMRRGFSDLIFKEILHSMAHLADKIGAILLVEGVENEDEFYGALDIGARCIQGFFVGYPASLPESLTFLEITISEFLKDFRKRKLDRLKAFLLYRESLANFFENKAKEYFFIKNNNGHVFLEPKNSLEDLAIWKNFLRLAFVVNEQGIQISPNYQFIKKDNQLTWEERHGFYGKDWSWRPYFQYFLAQKDVLEQKRIISEPYRDIRTGENIITLVYQLQESTVLCLDFSVAHLENPPILPN